MQKYFRAKRTKKNKRDKCIRTSEKAQFIIQTNGRRREGAG